MSPWSKIPRNPQPALTWRGFDEADIVANTGGGQSVLVQETWDPAWHAYENGKELPIRTENTMGFMLIDAPEGEHTDSDAIRNAI